MIVTAIATQKISLNNEIMPNTVVAAAFELEAPYFSTHFYMNNK